MGQLRIATFNCENLFSRAKALNIQDKAATSDILDGVAKLQKILKQATYSAEDKKAILDLANKYSTYIEIAEDRGKLFSGRGKKRRVVANGSGGWDGSIKLRRAGFDKQIRGTTAKLLKELKADIQCLVEVEDRQTVAAFNSQMLQSAFPYNLVVEGNDARGIDVGILAKWPILNIKTHIFDRDGDDKIFSRDCLELELGLADGRSLFLLINHFKSQGYGDQKSSDAKRKRQASRVAEILKNYDLKKDLVVVAGDFNDSPERPPLTLQPLLSVNGLTDVLALKFANPADRWTYYYKKPEQIDFILVSDPLKAACKDAGIERRGIFDLVKITKGKEKSYETVTSYANSASDHAGVWAEFSVSA